MDLVIFKGRKDQIWLIFYLQAISPKRFDNFFSSLSYNFPMRVLMDCQNMDFIESLKR